MCVVSMVLDTYTAKTIDYWKPQPPIPLSQEISELWQKAELARKIAELEELLQRAREYDKRNNEPDCELDEKRQALKKIADELGVEIRFL